MQTVSSEPLPFQPDGLIGSHRFGDGFFDGEALHAGGAVKAVHSFDAVENVFRSGGQKMHSEDSANAPSTDAPVTGTGLNECTLEEFFLAVPPRTSRKG
jgi:hypothetical protein